MDIATFREVVPMIPTLVDYAGRCYSWLRYLGISNESIFGAVIVVLLFGLILLFVYYVSSYFFGFFEHIFRSFFGFLERIFRSFFGFLERIFRSFFGFLERFFDSVIGFLERIFRSFFGFLEHFFDSVIGIFAGLASIYPSAVIASLSILFIFCFTLNSDLGENQRFILAVMAFGIITYCVMTARREERPTDLTRVQAGAVGVQAGALNKVDPVLRIPVPCFYTRERLQRSDPGHTGFMVGGSLGFCNLGMSFMSFVLWCAMERVMGFKENV
ncbi:6a2efe22-2db0-483d-8fe9-5ea2f2cdd71f [Sclerotinia trifoliorum]|uniref:6a2efe22-2db0-483d-8fe9-5ea2f2cdd71f n=1 Tax=Sclerotinia trifoliorum TaxID=28548 RepID=A0A8H2W0R1_9HELO|nr:6a2efe22-2db0-483d-8fe9-5ea2f2cdd71f [Sclerotinia trifoliorum]